MSLKKRGKYWHYEFMLHGERYWGSTKETVKSRATTFLSLLTADIQNKGANPRLKRCPTLKDFSVQFLEFIEKQTKASQLDSDTERYYKYGWRLLETTPLAQMRVNQITRSDAATVSFAGSPSYTNQAFRTLRRMLNLAVEWKFMAAAPKIATVEETGRTALIESAQESLLLRVANQPLKDILTIIMDAGLRPEEAMRMRWENILWDRRVVLVPCGKTKKSKRYVPLSDRVTSLLRSRQQGNTSVWVFPSKRAASGHLTTVANHWREACILANVVAEKEKLPPIPDNLVLYCARHTFATDMLSEMNTVQVKELMGHESLSTTMKYLHPETSGASDAVNRRNRARGLHLIKSPAKDDYDISSDIAVSEAV